MDNKTKALLIIGGVALSGLATWLIVRAVKNKKEQQKTGTTTTGTSPQYDKYGWLIMERAPGAPGKYIPTRANNPLDIRASSVKWDGQIGTTSSHGFCVFESEVMGLRAAFKNLQAYEKRGLKTLRQKFDTWAPATENSPTYGQDIAQQAGVAIDGAAPPSDLDLWLKVMPPWAKREGLEHPLTAETIRKAHKLAGLS